MPQVFFGKCCRLLKDQEKRVNQEFNRIFGNQRVDAESSNESMSLFTKPQQPIDPKFIGNKLDEDSFLEQNSTSCSTLVVNQKLKKIESDFRMVTSLYDDMQNYQCRQTESIDSVSKKFDLVSKNVEVCRESIMEVNQYETGADRSVVKIVVYCLSAMVILLMLRMFRI